MEMRGSVIHFRGMQYKIWENRKWLAPPVPIYSTKQTQAKSLSIHLLSLYFLQNIMYFRQTFFTLHTVCTVLEDIVSLTYHEPCNAVIMNHLRLYLCIYSLTHFSITLSAAKFLVPDLGI
jgi:hypothetical protein